MFKPFNRFAPFKPWASSWPLARKRVREKTSEPNGLNDLNDWNGLNKFNLFYSSRSP